MRREPTMRETAAMLVELRDSLVQLSISLNDLVFEIEASRDPKALDEMGRIFERYRCSGSRQPKT